MKNLKTIDTVREKKITTNIGFICDTKNIVKNKNIDKIKKIEYHVKRKKLFGTYMILYLFVLFKQKY